MKKIKLYILNILFVLLYLVPALTSADPVENNGEPVFLAIKKYAELANASYESSQNIEESVKTLGDSLVHTGNLPDLQVSFFVTNNDEAKTQVIAIRGTANIENALVDIDIKLEDDNATGVRIHRGFALAAKGILAETQKKLNKEYKLVLTGHSLGGAVAQVLAMYLDVAGYKIDQVITFGQPKVTNITGTLKFKHLNITRIVTPNDLVPLVPPLDPLDINKLDIYWHAGKEVILLENKDFSLTSGVQSMLRATKIFNQALGPENMQHHRMTQYLALVKSKLGQANHVPYQNDFSAIKSLLGFP